MRRQSAEEGNKNWFAGIELEQLLGRGQPVAGVDAYVAVNGATGSQTWAPPNGNVAPQVVLDPAAAKGSDGLVHPIALREVKVTQIIGGVCKQRTMIVFGSLVYKAPSDPA